MNEIYGNNISDCQQFYQITLHCKDEAYIGKMLELTTLKTLGACNGMLIEECKLHQCRNVILFILLFLLSKMVPNTVFNVYLL